MQIEKRTYSGPLLDVDIYPTFSDGRHIPVKAPKTNLSSEAQKKYNANKACKKFIRIINANFNKTDFYAHITFDDAHDPASVDDAKRILGNYFKRVKRKRAQELKNTDTQLEEVKEALAIVPDSPILINLKNDLKKKKKKLKQPFKYVYACEEKTRRSGEYKGLVKPHFHLFMSGGISNKELEEMWNAGVRMNCDYYQPDKFGPEAAAKYMLKDAESKKRYCCSLNLTKPVEKKKDTGLSRAGIARIAQQRVDDAKYWERKYPGYRFIKCFSRFNEWNAHWYISLVMYKVKEDPPAWNLEEKDWVTEGYTEKDLR